VRGRLQEELVEEPPLVRSARISPVPSLCEQENEEHGRENRRIEDEEKDGALSDHGGNPFRTRKYTDTVRMSTGRYIMTFPEIVLYDRHSFTNHEYAIPSFFLPLLSRLESVYLPMKKYR
jgi:hypothetical protein